MLYEIISPDAFLRPYLNNYATISGIYAVVRKAFAKQLYIDRDFQKKTNELVQKHIDTSKLQTVSDYIAITPDTIKIIREKQDDFNTKVINLIKSIEKTAEEASDDPFLVGMAERAKAVQEKYENRQIATSEAVTELLEEIEANERRIKEQAEKGFDGLTYFVYATLLDGGVTEAEKISQKIKSAFVEHPNWSASEKDLREIRQKMTFALYSEVDDIDKIKSIVDHLLTLILKTRRV